MAAQPRLGRKTTVILLTRLGGPVFALNPDLVERADCTPDTVITLVDGKKYLVAESLPEVISLIRQFRATVVADAQNLAAQPPQSASDGTTKTPVVPGDSTNVFQLHRRER
jgi:flagellar protein FlbD